jgi:hypothetical protein
MADVTWLNRLSEGRRLPEFDLWALKPLRAAAIVWVACLVFVAVGFQLAGPGWQSAYGLVHDGKPVPATVTELKPTDHDGCVYAFTVAGRQYSAQESRCGEDLHVGDVITVTYLPSDPRVSTTDSASDHLTTAIAFTLGLPTAIAGLVGWEVSRRRRRDKMV